MAVPTWCQDPVGGTGRHLSDRMAIPILLLGRRGPLPCLVSQGNQTGAWNRGCHGFSSLSAQRHAHLRRDPRQGDIDQLIPESSRARWRLARSSIACPSGRTVWHSRALGQTLCATEGWDGYSPEGRRSPRSVPATSSPLGGVALARRHPQNVMAHFSIAESVGDRPKPEADWGRTRHRCRVWRSF